METRKNHFVSLALAGAAGAAGLCAYLFVARPWHLRWGASQAEAGRALPGDELVPDPLFASTRAIAIQAPVKQVWAWLVQIGQGRGGFYSYDWLENLAGLDIHSADHILPEFQDLQVGDTVPFWRGAGVQVEAIELGRTLVLAGSFYGAAGESGQEGGGEVGGTWVFHFEPIDERATRLVVRSRIADFPPAWLSRTFSAFLLEPAHFVMERKMLLGIKQRAERSCPKAT